MIMDLQQTYIRNTIEEAVQIEIHEIQKKFQHSFEKMN